MILVCCCAQNFIVLDRMGRDVFTLEMTASRFLERVKLEYTRGCLRGFESLVIKPACLSRIERRVKS